MVNIGNMMKQAQQLQKKMSEAQEKLKSIEVEGISGGGMVKVIVNAKGDIKKIDIINKYSNSKSLILRFEELKSDPHSYLKKISDYTNSSYIKEEISLSVTFVVEPEKVAPASGRTVPLLESLPP